MQRKTGNCSISMGEAMITSILSPFNQRKTFCERRPWFDFNNLRLVLSMVVTFNSSMGKESKLKVRKVWGLISTFDTVS